MDEADARELHNISRQVGPWVDNFENLGVMYATDSVSIRSGTRHERAKTYRKTEVQLARIAKCCRNNMFRKAKLIKSMINPKLRWGAQ